MLPDDARAFLAENHRAVLTTFRRNRAAQMSIVAAGPYAEGVGLTVRGASAKLANLRRDPRCSILVSRPDWRDYVVVEGQARIMDWDNTGEDRLLQALRDVFRAAGGGEHPDWAEYDTVMRAERRAAVILVPQHTYWRKWQ